jgi:hypothetical protein
MLFFPFVTLEDQSWSSRLYRRTTFGITNEHSKWPHIAKFAKLSESIALIPLSDDMNDLVTRKLTNNEMYALTSAYKMQFEELTSSTMPPHSLDAMGHSKIQNISMVVAII